MLFSDRLDPSSVTFQTSDRRLTKRLTDKWRQTYHIQTKQTYHIQTKQTYHTCLPGVTPEVSHGSWLRSFGGVVRLAPRRHFPSFKVQIVFLGSVSDFPSAERAAAYQLTMWSFLPVWVLVYDRLLRDGTSYLQWNLDPMGERRKP